MPSRVSDGTDINRPPRPAEPERPSEADPSTHGSKRIQRAQPAQVACRACRTHQDPDVVSLAYTGATGAGVSTASVRFLRCNTLGVACETLQATRDNYVSGPRATSTTWMRRGRNIEDPRRRITGAQAAARVFRLTSSRSPSRPDRTPRLGAPSRQPPPVGRECCQSSNSQTPVASAPAGREGMRNPPLRTSIIRAGSAGRAGHRRRGRGKNAADRQGPRCRGIEGIERNSRAGGTGKSRGRRRLRSTAHRDRKDLASRSAPSPVTTSRSRARSPPAAASPCSISTPTTRRPKWHNAYE